FDEVAACLWVEDVDPISRVAGDDIAGRGNGAADGVVRGVVQEDTTAACAIADRGRAGRVGADVVALDEVGRAALDVHSILVSRDHVPRGGRGAPDGVGIAVVDEYARVGGAGERLAAGVQADEVPLNEVMSCIIDDHLRTTGEAAAD